MKFTTAAAVLAAVLATAGVASGQDVVTLVTNRDTTKSGDVVRNVPVGQRFTTGPHASGYVLTRIVIRLGDNGPDLAAKVCKSDGPTPLDDADNPCTALSPPSSFGAGDRTFTVPADTELDRNTEYSLVITPASGFTKITSSFGFNETSEYGWTIFNGVDYESGTGWSTDTAKIAYFSIHGYENPNAVPVITTTEDTFSVPEGTRLVTAFEATDADEGDVLTWTIIRSTLTTPSDSSAFAVSSSGRLTFVSAAGPDYENPTDSDRDNSYVVEVQVSDGVGGTASKTVTVNVTNEDEASDPPAPTPGGNEIWSAALDVQSVSAGVRGCGDGGCSAALTDDAFTYDSSYRVVGILLKDEDVDMGRVGSRSLKISFDSNLPSNTDLSLVVDGRTFAFEMSRTRTSTSRRWIETGLAWSVGASVPLQLTSPTSTPPPPPEEPTDPDPPAPPDDTPPDPDPDPDPEPDPTPEPEEEEEEEPTPVPALPFLAPLDALFKALFEAVLP